MADANAVAMSTVPLPAGKGIRGLRQTTAVPASRFTVGNFLWSAIRTESFANNRRVREGHLCVSGSDIQCSIVVLTPCTIHWVLAWPHVQSSRAAWEAPDRATVDVPLRPWVQVQFVPRMPRCQPDYGPSNYEPSDRSPVRLMEVASAAGVGAEVYDETPIGLLWFRNDWLQSHSIDPEQSNIISVRGASMEPTLLDGCSILVDRKRREPHEDRIYVMRTEEGLVVKRLGFDEEDRWELRSDNPDWRATPMSPEAEIVGEVRWVARTFS